jgi:hypothetical protein
MQSGWVTVGASKAGAVDDCLRPGASRGSRSTHGLRDSGPDARRRLLDAKSLRQFLLGSDPVLFGMAVLVPVFLIDFIRSLLDFISAGCARHLFTFPWDVRGHAHAQDLSTAP